MMGIEIHKGEGAVFGVSGPLKDMGITTPAFQKSRKVNYCDSGRPVSH